MPVTTAAAAREISAVHFTGFKVLESYIGNFQALKVLENDLGP